MRTPSARLGLPVLGLVGEERGFSPRPSAACERMRLDDGRPLRVLQEIGRGAYATVSRALLGDDGGIQRRVAAKLFASVASDEVSEVEAALVRAAKRNGCVDHPNVVRTYDFSRWNGQPLLLTELVDGVSLAELHRAFTSYGRRMPLDLTLFIAVEIAEGLAAAHAARGHDGEALAVLHHALSLREVLLSWNGEVKISDFEMSVACAASSSVRSASSIAGRIGAMAPEVAIGGASDARADVFSFGVLLRELLVGPRFRPGITGAEAVRLAREGYLEPVTFRPRLPRELESVMERALEMEPADRYPNASALVADLRPVALGMGVSDGRYFLRRTLEREWEIEEVTGQIRAVQPEGGEGALDDG
jgi:serine/threonine-protein kinase